MTYNDALAAWRWNFQKINHIPCMLLQYDVAEFTNMPFSLYKLGTLYIASKLATR